MIGNRETDIVEMGRSIDGRRQAGAREEERIKMQCAMCIKPP